MSGSGRFVETLVTTNIAYEQTVVYSMVPKSRPRLDLYQSL